MCHPSIILTGGMVLDKNREQNLSLIHFMWNGVYSLVSEAINVFIPESSMNKVWTNWDGWEVYDYRNLS